MPRAALTDAPKKIFKTIFIPCSFVTLATEPIQIPTDK